jgi:hypothetical protein
VPLQGEHEGRPSLSRWWNVHRGSFPTRLGLFAAFAGGGLGLKRVAARRTEAQRDKNNCVDESCEDGWLSRLLSALGQWDRGQFDVRESMGKAPVVSAKTLGCSAFADKMQPLGTAGVDLFPALDNSGDACLGLHTQYAVR